MTSNEYFKKAKEQRSQKSLPSMCDKSCDSGADCTICPAWKELSENTQYRAKEGIEIPTMGGRAENLRFRYDAVSKKVQVWRSKDKPDLTFDQAACHALCRRYQQGLKEGKLPLPTELGGTAYFTDPKWKTPILGRRHTPYAAAVIRHVWIVLKLPQFG
jgi:hypothetical protein